MEKVYNALEAEQQFDTLNSLKELLQTIKVVEEELEEWYDHLNTNFQTESESYNFCEKVLIPTISDYSYLLNKIYVKTKNSVLEKSLKQEVIDSTDRMSRNLYNGINHIIRKIPLPEQTAISMVYAGKNLENYKEE